MMCIHTGFFSENLEVLGIDAWGNGGLEGRVVSVVARVLKDFAAYLSVFVGVVENASCDTAEATGAITYYTDNGPCGRWWRKGGRIRVYGRSIWWRCGGGDDELKVAASVKGSYTQFATWGMLVVHKVVGK